VPVGYSFTAETGGEAVAVHDPVPTWAPGKGRPIVITGTYDGDGLARILQNFGFPAQALSNEAWMNWMMAEMFVSDDSLEDDFVDYEDDASQLAEEDGIFMVGMKKDGDKFKNPLSGYIQRISIMHWPLY
jgi:hypothetical protein